MPSLYDLFVGRKKSCIFQSGVGFQLCKEFLLTLLVYVLTGCV
jgi:hypothetical protein